MVPTATMIPIGGKSRSANSISSYYESKFLYLWELHGPLHGQAIYFIDRAHLPKMAVVFVDFTDEHIRTHPV